jgi:hypothetical protein
MQKMQRVFRTINHTSRVKTKALGGLNTIKPKTTNKMNTELNQEQLSAGTSSLEPPRVSDNSRLHVSGNDPISAQDYIRQIRIEQLSRGYIVHVGCQAFAFSTKEEMMFMLKDYIDRPAETETLWNKGELFQ